MSETYKVVRMYRDHPELRRTVKRSLTLEQAQKHCSDPETSSSTCQRWLGRHRTQIYGPWFDGYEDDPE